MDMITFELEWQDLESRYLNLGTSMTSYYRAYDRNFNFGAEVDGIFLSNYSNIERGVQEYVDSRADHGWWNFLLDKIVLPMWTALISIIGVAAFAIGAFDILNVVFIVIFGVLVVAGVVGTWYILRAKYNRVREAYQRTVFRWVRGYVWLLLGCELVHERYKAAEPRYRL